MKYLQKVCDGTIKVLEIREIISGQVPAFDELSPKVILPRVIKYVPEINNYLPKYPEGQYPPRNWFWTVLNTLDEGM